MTRNTSRSKKNNLKANSLAKVSILIYIYIFNHFPREPLVGVSLGVSHDSVYMCVCEYIYVYIYTDLYTKSLLNPKFL